MKNLAILSALAIAASVGIANAQMGGGMNQSGGMMNQQGMQGGTMNKRMWKKQMMAMKKQQTMVRRKNMSGM
jgi:hypothetical protein